MPPQPAAELQKRHMPGSIRYVAARQHLPLQGTLSLLPGGERSSGGFLQGESKLGDQRRLTLSSQNIEGTGKSDVCVAKLWINGDGTAQCADCSLQLAKGKAGNAKLVLNNRDVGVELDRPVEPLDSQRKFAVAKKTYATRCRFVRAASPRRGRLRRSRRLGMGRAPQIDA
jgi:hypothetical protein